MVDIYKTYGWIHEHNLDKKRKILTVFDNITADIFGKKNSTIVTELFIRSRRPNIYAIIFYCNKKY